MRGAAVVAAREIMERRQLVPAALAAGLLPLVLPYLGWPAAYQRSAAVAVPVLMATATALLAGGSVIGRELSERRLGFFFARPLGAGALWAGKMLGALGLTLSMTAASSASLAWLGLPPEVAADGPRSALRVALVLVGLIGLAHAASVGHRSRAPWFALDLVFAIAAAAWAADLAVRWRSHGFPPPSATLLGLAAVALLAAGAAQGARGRVDARRGHAVLSLVLWSTMLAGVAGFEARTAWLFRPAFGDLLALSVGPAAPRGPWAVVAGPAKEHGAMQWAFLVDPTTRRWVRLGLEVRAALAFSPDGRRAAWVGVDARAAGGRLSVVDLDEPELRPRTRALPEDVGLPVPIAISPDRGRLLALERRAAVILPLDGAGASRRVPLPEGWTAQAAFRDDVHAWLFHAARDRGSEQTLRIFDLDVSNGALRDAGRLATRGNAWVRLWAGGERLLLIDRADRRPSVTLHAMDGAKLATLVDEGTAHGVQADFLADGRIAVVQRSPGPRLRVFSPAGAEQATVELDAQSSSVVLGYEIAPGRLVVALGGPMRYPAESLVVDLAAGGVVARHAGLRPVAFPWPGRDAGSLSRPAPGSAATSLFHDDGGRVVRLDPATGTRAVVLEAEARR